MKNLMDELEELDTQSLKTIAQKFKVSHRGDKNTVIHNIYDRYCDIKKYISYTYIKQLGHEGKDGRTFLALNDQNQQVAIKIFRKNKKSAAIEREVKLQKIAAEYGISPKILDYDGDGKYIVMEKLDINLYDCFRKQNGQLTTSQQKSIIALFHKLDQCKVFHGDPNPLNFMKKDKKWYVIDFGFAKPINKNTIVRYGETPNIKFMPFGFLLKLRGVHKDAKLEYIESFCTKD